MKENQIRSNRVKSVKNLGIVNGVGIKRWTINPGNEHPQLTNPGLWWLLNRFQKLGF
jgi:hypothetical protein